MNSPSSSHHLYGPPPYSFISSTRQSLSSFPPSIPLCLVEENRLEDVPPPLPIHPPPPLSPHLSIKYPLTTSLFDISSSPSPTNRPLSLLERNDEVITVRSSPSIHSQKKRYAYVEVNGNEWSGLKDIMTQDECRPVVPFNSPPPYSHLILDRPSRTECSNGLRQASFRAAIHCCTGHSPPRVSHTTLQGQQKALPPVHSYTRSSRPRNTNVTSHSTSQSSMRRQRPKSYVLATSSSFPVDESNGRRKGSPILARRQLSDGIEEESRSDSHLAIRPSATIPSSTTTQRLHRLLALFSHSGGETSKGRDEHRKIRPKRSRTSVPIQRIALPSQLISIPSKDAIKQGALRHQELPLGVSLQPKKLCRSSEWRQVWAVLSGRRLYLCSQLSSQLDDNGEKLLSIPSDATCLHLEGALADIAYEYAIVKEEQRFIIRVVTQMRREHLLLCSRESDMLEWINRIQEASISTCSPSSIQSLDRPQKEDKCLVDNSIHSTTQLIMHRYKAKSSALASPVSSKRPSTEVSSSSSSSKAAPTSTSSASYECNGECTSSGGTPKTTRRWAKKGGKEKEKNTKQGGHGMDRAGPSTHSICSFGLGSRLADCPTAGDGDLVPLIVRACVSVVECHGMDTIGIYRIPGNTAAVNALKEALNCGELQLMDLDDTRWKDVNVVSSLLKMFLRKLPEPLLTDKLYPFFIDANRMGVHHQRLHKIRNLLRKLPRPHYDTLKYLIGHLLDVTRHSDINKMESRNLALMFGPSIVRPSDDTMATMVTHMSDQCKIVETFLNYFEWMFDDCGTNDDAVPSLHPSDIETREGGRGLDAPPPGVSSSSFNDMHSLIIRANEKEAEDMMKENERGKIKNILNVRRSSKRDKWKGKGLKIESTAPAAVNPLSSSGIVPSTVPYTKRSVQCTPTQGSVDSAFCGNYQERDIDAEIAFRSKSSSGGGTSIPSEEGRLDDEEEMETSRSEGASIGNRRRQQEDLHSARRIFIAGSEAAARDSNWSTVDALTSHTQHLNQAASPALEVYSAETREKIRRMQMMGRIGWRQMDKPSLSAVSPSREDAVSCTSDYSTTSSAPPSHPIGVLVVSSDALGPSSSDYASSHPSPCTRNASISPRTAPVMEEEPPPKRPDELAVKRVHGLTVRKGARDKRRHTLALVDTVEEGSSAKSSFSFSRWITSGLLRGKSFPDVRDNVNEDICVGKHIISEESPPIIVRTSPNELTPASGDEQL